MHGHTAPVERVTNHPMVDGDDVEALQAGRTALHRACAAVDSEQAARRVEELVLAGAAVGARDGFGSEPLHLVCAGAEAHTAAHAEAAVASLLGAGAPTAKLDDRGRSALHFAADRGLVGAVEMLLRHDAVVDAKTPHGDTALLWAAKAGRVAVADALLAAGADPRLRNSRDESALSVTADAGLKARLQSVADGLDARDRARAEADEAERARRRAEEARAAAASGGAARPAAPFKNASKAPVKKMKITLKPKKKAAEDTGAA